MYKGIILISFVFLPISGFLFPAASGGCGCGCSQQAACAPAAPCCGAARARHDKTLQPSETDELELRARLTGLPLDQQPVKTKGEDVPTQGLAVFEQMGEVNAPKNVHRQKRADPFSKEVGVDGSVKDETLVKVDQSTPSPIDEAESAKTEKPETDDDIKCNSQVLKKLILEQITENSSISKRRINKEAEKVFGGRIDVICSRGHFSYVYSSSLFCEATKGEVTCIAFRQSH
ncbi:unnamed protein product [Bursaphelenchus xylophilus]|uniref:(pine wood nematode) hypothetical protein n=1 Tax=Bursaphelenchus xylophilus TaxID=6326 RepID=A0A1I7S5R4_BURXY|nr:unnamed protein product [Bursaphelenchus xylophilus]CAG9124987.1 unnamed protein product [Bursaphelenchus xylophilus]